MIPLIDVISTIRISRTQKMNNFDLEVDITFFAAYHRINLWSSETFLTTTSKFSYPVPRMYVSVVKVVDFTDMTSSFPKLLEECV